MNVREYHPLNPIGFAYNHSKAAKTLLFIGGVSAACYLAYTYRYFPGIQFYPREIQSILLTPQQLLATCMTSAGAPRNLEGSLRVFNCYNLNDPKFNALAKSNANGAFYCQKLTKDIFRTFARLIHPDKATDPQDKDLFQNAMGILGLAKELIHRQFCTEEGKIAQCVLAAPYPRVPDLAKRLLSCAGGVIPSTCGNFINYTSELSAIVSRVFPNRDDLVRKVAMAYQVHGCYPVPAFIANLFS